MAVTLVHRRDELRANKVAQKRAFQNPKMHFLFSHVVTEILGEDQVTGVRLKNLKTGEEYVYPTDGVFVFIGHEPNTAFLKGVVELRPDGYIAVRDEVFTSEPGIFAAGASPSSSTFPWTTAPPTSPPAPGGWSSVRPGRPTGGRRGPTSRP